MIKRTKPRSVCVLEDFMNGSRSEEFPGGEDPAHRTSQAIVGEPSADGKTIIAAARRQGRIRVLMELLRRGALSQAPLAFRVETT
jgi:hypothetical protein